MSFTDKLDQVLSPIADKLSNNKYLRSMADGIIACMPLTMVASIFSVINTLPNILPFLPAWSAETSAMLLMPYNLCFGILGLVISFTVAYRHAKHYDLNQLHGGIISLVTFLLIAAGYSGGTFQSTSFLGYAGIFTAVLVAIGTTELNRFLIKHKIRIKMPESVPPLVGNSFEAMIPLFIIIGVFYGANSAVTALSGQSIPALIQRIVAPAITGGDTLGYQMALHFFMQLFFWLGMHGWAILAGISMPISTALQAEQAAAYAAGQPLPYITAFGSGFANTLWFIPLLLIVACKAKRNKAIGKLALVPSIFGISEPYTFGTPVVLNPILGIPFIIYQPILSMIGYLSVKWGFMNRAGHAGLTGVPAPFSTYIATDGDWRVFIVFAISVAVAIVIWYPFIKVWDNKCLREEAEIEAAKAAEEVANNIAEKA